METSELLTIIYYSLTGLYVCLFIGFSCRFWYYRTFTKTITIQFLEPDKLIKGNIYQIGYLDTDLAMYVGENKFKQLRNGKTRH